MAIIQQRSPAEILYQQLQQTYRTKHTDSQDEQREAVRNLELALAEGATTNQLLAMAQRLNKAHGDIKHKLSNLIAGRFWEQVLETKQITAMGWQEPRARHYAEFSLEP